MRRSSIYAFLTGAAYGLTMRLIFGLWPFSKELASGYRSGPMLGSFVLIVPAVVGVLTVYASTDSPRRITRSLLEPWMPISIFVVGTGLLLIEGSICMVMAFPIFLFMGSLGGLLTWAILRMTSPPDAVVRSVALLPLVLGLIELQLALPREQLQTAMTIHIDAPPETVWTYINNAVDIRRDEMSGGIAYLIGVPYPVEARTFASPLGRTRRLRWEMGVAFDEEITHWEPNEFIRWEYRFTEDSFPPQALDEHVRIGGSYFDLIDSSYRLSPEAGGTRLKILVTYRVSTSFNWYAEWWARLLIDDTAKVILRFYKERSETHHAHQIAAGVAPPAMRPGRR
jgi:uncharacterized protein YndB with AHSA1/START domain